MYYVVRVLAALALLIIIVFSFQNLETIDVAFLFWKIDVSKTIVILGAYLLGMISGGGLVGLLRKSLHK